MYLIASTHVVLQSRVASREKRICGRQSTDARFERLLGLADASSLCRSVRATLALHSRSDGCLFLLHNPATSRCFFFCRSMLAWLLDWDTFGEVHMSERVQVQEHSNAKNNSATFLHSIALLQAVEDERCGLFAMESLLCGPMRSAVHWTNSCSELTEHPRTVEWIASRVCLQSTQRIMWSLWR